MSLSHVSPVEMRTYRSFDDHTVEELLSGRCPEGRDELEALAALTRSVRTAYRRGPQPQMREQLAAYIESPLTDPGHQPSWRDATRRKTAAMLTAVSTFVATITGKIVLGTAVTAAAVGGLHAADAVDVPGLPDRASSAEEHQSDAGDVGTAGHEDGGEGHGTSDESDPGDFGSSVSDDAESGDLDPAEVVDQADDFGTSTATKNAEGTEGEDNIPEDPTSGAEAGSESSETGTSTAQDPPANGGDAQSIFRP